MDWQPIDTAPKGRFVLLFGPNGHDIGRGEDWTGNLRWERYPTAEYGNEMATIEQPTHWMPLPKAPDA